MIVDRGWVLWNTIFYDFPTTNYFIFFCSLFSIRQIVIIVIRFNASVWKPYTSSFVMKRSCGMQSKALNQFVNNAPKASP